MGSQLLYNLIRQLNCHHVVILWLWDIFLADSQIFLLSFHMGQDMIMMFMKNSEVKIIQGMFLPDLDKNLSMFKLPI